MQEPTDPREEPDGGVRLRPDVLRAGGAVVADAGRLLRVHWPALLLLAVVGVLARELLLEAAVVVSRASSVLSQLVLALAPFAQLLTVVGMLLVMRRRGAGERPVLALVTGAAAVMLPFLVIYEHYGNLADDVVTFGAGTADDLVATITAPGAGDGEIASRLPAGTSLTVLTSVAVALVLRRLLDRLASRAGSDGRRSSLRLAAGYCEVVWLVLGAYVVTVLADGASTWWSTRRVGAGLATWWESVTITWPTLGTVAETAASGAGLLLAAAATAFLVPLAWLALAAIIYGVQAARVLTARDLHGARVAGRAVGLLGDVRTDRALRLATDPGRRYGAVLGATVLVVRAGWQPILMFCLAFLLADNAAVVVTELARAVVGPQTLLAWSALLPVVDTAGTVLARVLTLALVASAVDSLLRNLGLPGGLRLPPRSEGQGEELRPQPELAGARARQVEAGRL
ncbi:hypothetical protein [Georgenia daeguensis]|uniref:ABC transporter permease subunit n=1 Tax=Georgenia daeguensis TaxID=908355 RepID=A0ABP8EX09_9MICO